MSGAPARAVVAERRLVVEPAARRAPDAMGAAGLPPLVRGPVPVPLPQESLAG